MYRIHSQVHSVVWDDSRASWADARWTNRIRKNKGLDLRLFRRQVHFQSHNGHYNRVHEEMIRKHVRRNVKT